MSWMDPAVMKLRIGLVGHQWSSDPQSHGVAAQVAGSRGMAVLEFPDGSGQIDAGSVEMAATACADHEPLAVLGAFARPPFVDETAILPVADTAFGQPEGTGGVFSGAREFK